jgi:hypothetical protein
LIVTDDILEAQLVEYTHLTCIPPNHHWRQLYLKYMFS